MRALLAAARVGLKEMAGDWARFSLLIICLAVGTALIAGVSSVSSAITRAVDQNAAMLMGGDLEFTRSDRAANASELAILEQAGTLASVVETNLGAESMTGDAFVDLVAAGPGYPLLGGVGTSDAEAMVSPFNALEERNGMFGALVDPVMLDQLGLAIGDTISIGGTDFEVRGTLTGLPDGPVRGFRLGLSTLLSTDGFAHVSDRTSPLPGLGTNFRYKLLLASGDTEAERTRLAAELGDAGWEIRSALDGLGPMLRYYELFTGFLMVVGLGSLLIGGVSVWSVMSAYIGERSGVIAVLRSLGASRWRVLVHFLVQVLALGLIGVGIGIAVGVTIGLVVLPAVGEAIGIPLARELDLLAVLVAGAVGLLTAFAFSYLPLVQAQMVSPANLFRSKGLGAPRIDWRKFIASPELLPLAVAILLFFWLAVVLTKDLTLVLAFAGSAIGAAVLLQLGSRLALIGLAKLPAARWRPLRQSLRAIIGTTRNSSAVVTAVGLAMVILVVVQVLAINLRNEFLGASVFDAPTLVASDLFPDEMQTLEASVGPEHGIELVTATPMLRGTVMTIAGTPIENLAANGPEAAFLLSGEIPMTYRSVLPPASRLVEGQWWPADYTGPALVSLHQNLRQGLGVKLGDEVTFEIFGETVTAKVGNFRDYAWQGGIDFLVAFSPGVLDNYPSTILAAVTAEPGREEEVERFLANEFIDVKFIEIGATLTRITEALSQLSLAVAAVGGIAVLNGLLILIGSLAAGRRQRESDAVLNKVLGAKRSEILVSALIQFLLLAVFAALIAIPSGIFAAWLLTQVLLNVAFAVDPATIGVVVAGLVGMTAILGATTLLRVLSIRPALLLREMSSV
ncbi:FtsX-like permease family protein [Devosia sp.]|uniref:ABC transporter permease n=1 Tax=Devosia sp. TaxID=1871048 RepID=UPI001B194E89|nr:FtsX-like permease family protein [Devosia sp.]MBO9590337.1 FtsX-like permease family protein [Devosia sp.]